jgi:signal transduction histidine kinase
MANRKALVLHDDARTVEMVRAVAGSEGFDVEVAETPWRLVDAAAGPAPDLLLLGLGEVDDRDVELVAILRRRWPRVAIVILFPALLRERAARCLELGADAYLPEPFYPAELGALARAAAKRATGLEASPEVAPEAPVAAPAGRAGDEGLAKLAAGAAHSIRNPLQILELQLAAYEADGKLDVAGLREQLARIAGVAESLTRFSGRRKLETRVVDVNSLVQRVFGDPSRKGRPARVRLCAERLEVLGAPDLLRAALDAVHDRARAVSPETAIVDVDTSAVEERGARFAEIAVTDAGPPLPADRLATFFEPFPDADRIVEGTGLELAAVAGIVRNHGGSASVRPGSAGGTTVVLRLPVRGRATPRTAGEAS